MRFRNLLLATGRYLSVMPGSTLHFGGELGGPMLAPLIARSLVVAVYAALHESAFDVVDGARSRHRCAIG